MTVEKASWDEGLSQLGGKNLRTKISLRHNEAKGNVLHRKLMNATAL